MNESCPLTMHTNDDHEIIIYSPNPIAYCNTIVSGTLKYAGENTAHT